MLRGTTGGGAGTQITPPIFPPPASDPRQAQAQRLADEAHAALVAQRWSDAYLRAEMALDVPGNEHNAALRADLALAYAGAGRWLQARDALERAAALDPFLVDLWRTLAQAERRLGDFVQADAALDRAQAVTPPTAILSSRPGAWISPSKQQWAEALAKLDDELALAPNDVMLLDARLDLLRHLNRTADALALARQLAARPDATAAASWRCVRSWRGRRWRKPSPWTTRWTV